MRGKKTLATGLTLLFLLLAGCGSGNNGKDSGAAAGNTASSADISSGWDIGFGGEAAPMEPSADEQGTDSSVYQNAGAKLVRRAEFSIQTEQFDQTVQALDRLVSECGGYFETASVRGGSYRDASASRWGEYVVRVPAERYSDFFNSAGTLGYITESSESSEDVGERYYDAETRLKTQRTKQERLLALLEQADTMEDIISLENALGDVEYQIEQLSSTLNRYDALISYSTFTIYLQEVGKVVQEVGESSTLGQRMTAGFKASCEGFVRGAQELLVWMSYNLVVLVILIAAAAMGGWAGLRKYKKWKTEQSEKQEP